MHRLSLRSTTLLFSLSGLAVGAAGGTPSFDAPVGYPAEFGAYGLAAGDLDNDGAVDLITTSNTGFPNDPLRIFWNDGSGGFAATGEVDSGDGPREIVLADYDADGDLDLFVSNYFSNDMYLIPNNGDRSFGSPTSYATGGGSQGIDTGDIDGDGDPDFVGTDHFGSRIRPYRNINGLGFASVGLFGVGNNPWALELADMDGDGDLDSVVTSEESPIVSVAYNAGDGTFPTSVDLSVGVRPTGVAVGDFNGDGANDIVTANWGMLSPINNTVSVLIADGDGGFAPAVEYTAFGRPGSVEVADIDSDGELDLVVACEADDGFAVLTGNGDGTFNDAMLFDLGTQPGRIALADFDGDGDIDVASAGDLPREVAVAMNTTGTPVDPMPLEVEWQASHDNFFQQDVPTHIAVAPGGNVVMAGETAFSDNEQDYLVVAFDPSGNLLWEYTYNGTGDHYDKIIGLRIDSAGNAIVTGRSYGTVGLGEQWTTVKLDPDGNELWVRRFDGGNAAAFQVPRGLAVGPNDEIAVCGWARDASFEDIHYTVILYDAAGNLLWERYTPGASPDGQAEDVAFDASGNVVAIGGVAGSGGLDDAHVVKLSPAGDVLWADTLATRIGTFVETDSDGNVYAAAGATLRKYDPDGTVLWTESLAGITRVDGLAERADGTFLIHGSVGGNVRMTVLDGAGETVWSVATPVGFYSAQGEQALTVQSDGVIALLGQMGTDLGVYRYNADGELIDETRIDSGSSTDFRVGIASDGATLYAAGSFEPRIVNRRDFLLFRIEETAQGCNAGDVAEPFGVLDLADVQAFVAGFAAQDPVADIDGSGVFDLADVQGFVASFNAGCP